MEIINIIANIFFIVFLLDRTGTIRYLEIVKELGHLPDMGKAFIAASSL